MRNVPGEERSHLHRGGSLKSPIFWHQFPEVHGVSEKIGYLLIAISIVGLCIPALNRHLKQRGQTNDQRWRCQQSNRLQSGRPELHSVQGQNSFIRLRDQTKSMVHPEPFSVSTENLLRWDKLHVVPRLSSSSCIPLRPLRSFMTRCFGTGNFITLVAKPAIWTPLITKPHFTRSYARLISGIKASVEDTGGSL